MRIIWDYIKISDGIRIIKAWGEESCLQIPEDIEGIPVTEIGPYAFSAAEVPRRFRINADERQRLVTEWGVPVQNGSAGIWMTAEGSQAERQKTQEEPVAGNRLQAIRLPATVTAIGDYAFYGCGKLEEVAFTDSLQRIGSGAFMGCGAVRRLEVIEDGSGKNSLYQMLSELRYAIKLTIKSPGKKEEFVVPEYYETSVENIPARILELHFQGTGYRYRQCFRDGKVWYREYDELFRLAESQEPPEVLTQLAYCRIKYPNGLSGEAKKEYLEWFSAHVREAGEYFLKRDDLESVRLICESGGFDGTAETEKRSQGNDGNRKVVADGAGDFYMASMGENVLGEEENVQQNGKAGGENGAGFWESPRASLDVLMEMAGRMGRTEILSCLMDYRHRKQGSGRQKKVFEF
ncbi:MAG: leucine-rich repeat domain-containing protein [Lachnospiraceae bacterium]|nr:leucine-rich repeat domain-containing protein [Lachnospiraceae bacterium]